MHKSSNSSRPSGRNRSQSNRSKHGSTSKSNKTSNQGESPRRRRSNAGPSNDGRPSGGRWNNDPSKRDRSTPGTNRNTRTGRPPQPNRKRRPTPVPVTPFDQFGLGKGLRRGIAAAGFDEPRPIQRDAIPAAMEGRDVLGLAATGTGKTAAFALPMLERLLAQRPDRRAPAPRALVLAPTRELATQIAEETERLAKFTHLEVATVFGGVPQRKQERALRRRPAVVVGCPGRVLDLVQQEVLDLGGVEILVLDEADHMFDLGFLPTLRKILEHLPEHRQNLLFSATMPTEVRHLADDLLAEPHIVELEVAGPAETIDHALFEVGETQKRELLQRILDAPECRTAIVFTRTKHRARRLADQLHKAGHRAVALQGNMSQNQRTRAMGGFKDGSFDILVATDIAARGIDVSGVSHVVNFDVPNTPEAYTHRIGRTGRATLTGTAFTFVTGADHGWLRATERRLEAKIRRERAEGIEPEAEQRAEPKRRRRGPRRPQGRRPQGTTRGSGRGPQSRNRSGGGRQRRAS